MEVVQVSCLFSVQACRETFSHGRLEMGLNWKKARDLDHFSITRNLDIGVVIYVRGVTPASGIFLSLFDAALPMTTHLKSP